ncbi:MAG: methionyl-tRNA formyltransferase [Campylobacterales bacterium]
MRVVFFGSSSYSATIYEALRDDRDIEVVAVFTQPDKPVGRKKRITPCVMKQFLLDTEDSVELFQPKSLKDEGVYESLEALEPDFIVVASYGQIVPKNILDICPPINLHASLLPEFRGASPIHEVILLERRFTGVSSMYMSEGLDEGDVLGFRYVEIGRDESIEELFNKLSVAAATLALSTLKEYKKLVRLKQFTPKASYCKKVKKSDGLLSLNSAMRAYKKYRAFKQWPGVMLENELKLKKVLLASKDGYYRRGEIVRIEKEWVDIGCDEGFLRVASLQASGKKEVDAPSYIRGRRLEVGDTIL